MKIRLIEKVPDISEDQITNYMSGGLGEKDKIADEIIDLYEKPDLKNIQKAIKYSFKKYGLNRSSNPFIEFFDNLKFSVKKPMESNFQKLIQMYDKELVNLGNDYLKDNASLYEDRGVNDFEYTINSFESVLDTNTLEKYFDDTDEISVDDFYNGSTIKPAGLDQAEAKEENPNGYIPDTNTIYGTIENWQKLYGAKKSSTNSISIKKYIKEKQFTDQDFVSFITNSMSKTGMAGNITNLYQPKNSDINYYVEKVKEVMAIDAVILSNAQQRRLLKDPSYEVSALDKIKPEMQKEGAIFVTKFKYHGKGPTDDSMLFGGDKGLVIYHNGKWQKYDDYIKNVNVNNKKKFLNEKVISNTKDIYSVLAGIIIAIDNIYK